MSDDAEQTHRDFHQLVNLPPPSSGDGYARSHLAQGPENKSNIPESRWRYSLMNWGHDPLKD